MERLHTTILKFDRKEWDLFEQGKKFCFNDELWELMDADNLLEKMRQDYEEYIATTNTQETFEDYKIEVFVEYAVFFSLEELLDYYNSEDFSYDILKEDNTVYFAITLKY